MLFSDSVTLSKANTLTSLSPSFPHLKTGLIIASLSCCYKWNSMEKLQVLQVKLHGKISQYRKKTAPEPVVGGRWAGEGELGEGSDSSTGAENHGIWLLWPMVPPQPHWQLCYLLILGSHIFSPGLKTPSWLVSPLRLPFHYPHRSELIAPRPPGLPCAPSPSRRLRTRWLNEWMN